MKVIEKSTCHKVYRFRCYYCESALEMTEEERKEEDLRYDESFHKGNRSVEDRRNDKDYRPHNPKGYFLCPVCNRKSYAAKRDWHCFTIMENGREVMDY